MPGGAGALPAPTSTTNNRGSFSSLLFFAVMLFMLMNGGGDDLIVRNQYRESLRSLRFQQANFSAWLSGSGAETNFTLVREILVAVLYCRY